jgi:1-acyl-sn-glycerol-3-phosphate acyltransferase
MTLSRAHTIVTGCAASSVPGARRGDRTRAVEAYIIAPTHRSNLDTPFASFVTKRRIRFMAKQEMFQHPLARSSSLLWRVPVEQLPERCARSRRPEPRVTAGEPVAMFPKAPVATGVRWPTCSTAPRIWR